MKRAENSRTLGFAGFLRRRSRPRATTSPRRARSPLFRCNGARSRRRRRRRARRKPAPGTRRGDHPHLGGAARRQADPRRPAHHDVGHRVRAGGRSGRAGRTRAHRDRDLRGSGQADRQLPRPQAHQAHRHLLGDLLGRGPAPHLRAIRRGRHLRGGHLLLVDPHRDRDPRHGGHHRADELDLPLHAHLHQHPRPDRHRTV